MRNQKHIRVSRWYLQAQMLKEISSNKEDSGLIAIPEMIPLTGGFCW